MAGLCGTRQCASRRTRRSRCTRARAPCLRGRTDDSWLTPTASTLATHARGTRGSARPRTRRRPRPSTTRRTASSRSAESTNGEVACRNTVTPGGVAGTDGDLVERVQQCGDSELAVSPASSTGRRITPAPSGVRGIGDAVVVGRHEHGVDAARADRRADRAGDQRHARDGREVLAPEALGAASSGHDGDDPRRGGRWRDRCVARLGACRKAMRANLPLGDQRVNDERPGGDRVARAAGGRVSGSGRRRLVWRRRGRSGRPPRRSSTCAATVRSCAHHCWIVSPGLAGLVCLALAGCTPSAPARRPPRHARTDDAAPTETPAALHEPESRYGLECDALGRRRARHRRLLGRRPAVDPLVTASGVGIAIPRRTSILSQGGTVCEWSNGVAMSTPVRIRSRLCRRHRLGDAPPPLRPGRPRLQATACRATFAPAARTPAR